MAKCRRKHEAEGEPRAAVWSGIVLMTPARRATVWGRIIYFLRFRSPASSATAEDLKLGDILAEKLRAKGQWTGRILRMSDTISRG
jgi:hypothetical protein